MFPHLKLCPALTFGLSLSCSVKYDITVTIHHFTKCHSMLNSCSSLISWFSEQPVSSFWTSVKQLARSKLLSWSRTSLMELLNMCLGSARLVFHWALLVITAGLACSSVMLLMLILEICTNKLDFFASTMCVDCFI